MHRFIASPLRLVSQWALLAATLWTLGCGPEPLPPTLEVEYAGCSEVLEGAVCVPGAQRALRLWILTTGDTHLQLFTDQVEIPVGDTMEVDGGRLFTVTVAEGATHLAVRALSNSGETSWELALATGPPEASEASTRATAFAAAGYQAMRTGDFDQAVQSLAAARAAYAAAGWRLTEAMTAASEVFCQLQQRHFLEARAVLESLQCSPPAPGEVLFQKSFYQGAAAVAAGDSRSALESLAEAGERARRLGLERELGMSEEVLALGLRQVGRAREAAEIFARLRAEKSYGATSADGARLLNNHAWTLLLAREGGEGGGEGSDDPLPLLEEARQSFDTHAERSDQRVNVRLNLALAHLHAGHPQEARRALDEAAALVDEPPVHLRLWWLDIEARIALAEGDHDTALRLYDRLEQLATSAFDPEGRWRAAVGRARAHSARGTLDAAQTALAEAETLLDEQSLLIPLDQGRETFMAQRGASVRLYLDLLLTEGEDQAALEVARRSRSRVLRALRYQERLAQLSPTERETWEQALTEYRLQRTALDAALGDDWRLRIDELDAARTARAALSQRMTRALDRAFTVFADAATTALPEPRPGELILAYHPLPQGWVSFAAARGEVRTQRFELPPKMATPADLAAVLLTPFEEEILAAERLRILPFGPLREVDFHALPFSGDILLRTLPVVYGLDLVTRGTSSAGSRHALLVADPRGDLPAARREATTVHDALTLGHPPWRVEVLTGQAAEAEAVTHWLPQVDLLHYAGHGVFSGRSGWESALPLANSSRLTPADLFAVGHAPRWVVLSGCDTARSASPGVLGIGIAHAFLLGGSQQVVAAMRPVDDRSAERLFQGFYRDLDATPDLALRLQQEQLKGHLEGNDDWASFRVLEP